MNLSFRNVILSFHNVVLFTALGLVHGRNADYQLEFGVEALQTMDGTDPFVPFISTGGTMRTNIESALDTMGACHITTGELKCYAALRSGGSVYLFDSHACTGTVEPSLGGATDAAALFRFNSVRDLSRFILVRGYSRVSRSYEVAPIRAVFLKGAPNSDDVVVRNPRDSVTHTVPSTVTGLEPASEAAVEVELLPTAATQRTDAGADVPNVEVEAATAQAVSTEIKTEGSEVVTEGAEVAAGVTDVEVAVATVTAEATDAETEVSTVETEVPDVEVDVPVKEAEDATVKAAASEAEFAGAKAVAEVAKVARKKAPWYRRLFRCLSCVRGEKD